MNVIQTAVVVLILMLAIVASVHGEPEDDAMVKALMAEGLTHDQAVRVHEKILQSKETTTPQENPMEKTETAAPKRFPVVPTTRIMAIGRFTTPPTPEQVKEIFPKEVPATLKLYLEGKIDQWWVRQDQTGPIFLMNVTTIPEAEGILEKLPLGVTHLMKFEYIELGPLTPLHMLLSPGWANGGK